MFKSTKTFAERLNDTKSIFQKALEDAKELKDEMTAKITEKEQQIESIKAEIDNINFVAADTDKFITNLTGLV